MTTSPAQENPTTYHTAVHTPAVLIVEDDPLLLKMYCEKFTVEGFQVIGARDGEEAIEIVRKVHPDCVLLDMSLPKKNGLEFLDQIKKMGVTTPILTLSNIADHGKRSEAIKLGIREYLIKAMLTPEQVVLKVKHHMTNDDTKNSH